MRGEEEMNLKEKPGNLYNNVAQHTHTRTHKKQQQQPAEENISFQEKAILSDLRQEFERLKENFLSCSSISQQLLRTDRCYKVLFWNSVGNIRWNDIELPS